MTLQEWKIEDRAVPNTALRDQKEEAKTCPEEEVQHHVPYQLTHLWKYAGCKANKQDNDWW